MINIKIKYEITVTQRSIGKLESRSGIYVFLNKEKKPLYVGQANDLKTRIYSHFKGLTNTSMHSHHFHKCKVFYEDKQLNKDIYELYLINTLKTPVNLSKSYRVNASQGIKISKKRNERTFCNHIKANGEPCKNHAHGNGYCFLHGGNGITRKSIYESAKNQFNELREE